MTGSSDANSHSTQSEGGAGAGAASGPSSVMNSSRSEGGSYHRSRKAHIQNRGSIAITSLLSSKDTENTKSNNNNDSIAVGGSGSNGSEGRLVHGGFHRLDGANTTAMAAGAAGTRSSPSPPSSAFTSSSSYQRQESTASSVSGTGAGAGEFVYTPLGGAPLQSSRASTPNGGDGPPGGRPPLVRKRSLTVAMDADPASSTLLCPSPRGRRRSVDGPLDTKDGHPDSSGGAMRPTALLESPSRSPRLVTVGNNGVPIVGGGGGAAAGKMMEAEWIANENAHLAAAGMLPTPSPIASIASVSSVALHPPLSAASSAAAIDRRPPSPSPYPPSPGREYRRAGVIIPQHQQRVTPHSPSPRGAPPSPAQAPGSAGLRQMGTRRLSGGRSTPRGVRWRAGPGAGKGAYAAGGGSGEGFGGGGGGGAGGSGTYESDYDSDLSELSAYSNYSAIGSLERQLQQDTFFELDESLWRVVTRREVRVRDFQVCVYDCVFVYLCFICFVIVVPPKHVAFRKKSLGD